MKHRIVSIWDALNSSLWFVPSLMVLVTIGFSFATLAIDETVKRKTIVQAGWLWNGGPSGARDLLSTIAGSMITVAGVVFSITIVVLALASSQFGPRLLRNFMRDISNQVVLGTFISTFTYCLLILRTIRDNGASEFVPHISVTVGILSALASLGVLIYFIHHVSVSIQAPMVIARVAEELDRSIARLFPEQLEQNTGAAGDKENLSALAPDFLRQPFAVPSTATGYLQAIDVEALLAIAEEKDLTLRLNYRPGHFVVKGAELVLVWPKESGDRQLADTINRSFILGAQRTEAQDVEYSVHQLVEVAVRALSPGINDPFTAMTCTDRLGAALCRLAVREIPSPYRYDTSDMLRVIAPGVTFAEVTDQAFNQIRQYGRSSAAVTIRLLEVLTLLAHKVRTEADRAALLRHAAMIERGGREGLPEEQDRNDVKERYRNFLTALDAKDKARADGAATALRLSAES